MRTVDEEQAIKQAVSDGRKHGFGNMIQCLMLSWAIMLIEKYDMPIDSACEAAWICKSEAKEWASRGLDAMKRHCCYTK